MTKLETFTQALIDAHRTGQRVTPDIPDMSRAEILSVQSTVSAALGPVAGFKVGETDDLPIIAPIPAIYQIANGGSRTVQGLFGIELEVGFEVIRVPTGPGLPETPQDYFRPHVVLELVDTRLAGPAAEDPLFKFADFQINSGVVIGPGLSDWDGSDFGTVSAQLMAGSSSELDGKATVPGGSALSNLNLFLTHVGDHCGGLKEGQIVITGSLCGLLWFEGGTEISGRIQGLGDVAISLLKG